MASKLEALIKAKESAGVATIERGVGYTLGQMLAIAAMQTNGGTQARDGINAATVAEYAQAMRDGAEFPLIIVYHDGQTYWLADGFHRVAAAQDIGRTELRAEIRQGTRRDAVLFACGANAAHGLRRTNADKRRAVETLLRDEEWRQWSDSEIARRCLVSHPTVAQVRRDLYPEKLQDSRTVERGGTIYQMTPAAPSRPNSPAGWVWRDDNSLRNINDGSVVKPQGTLAATVAEAERVERMHAGAEPFWQSLDAHHPTAHLWTRERPDLWRSGCGLTTQNRAPNGSTEAGHCTNCALTIRKDTPIPLPERRGAPAQEKARCSVPGCDQAGVGSHQLYQHGIWQWYCTAHATALAALRKAGWSFPPAAGQYSGGGWLRLQHADLSYVRNEPTIVDALRAAADLQAGFERRAKLQAAAPDAGDDKSQMDMIRAQAAALGVELVWEDEGVILYRPGEDLDQLLPLSYADALDWLASQAAPTPAAADELPGQPSPFPHRTAGVDADRGFSAATREQLAALGWDVNGKHSGDERTTPWLDLRKIDDHDVVRRLTQDEFRTLLGRPTSAALLEQLDSTMPDDLFRAGYFWKSAEPPTVEHVDGWTGEAPTPATALQLARTRARVLAERAAVGIPERPPRPTTADPLAIHKYLVELEAYATGLERRISELTKGTITNA